MNPTVSFVVPCYKYAHYLAECVNSILAQTYGDFEVLIMDDCSPDNTPEVAASFKDARVVYVRQEKNVGAVPNTNEGIERARGKYVWPVSADDGLARNDALERYVTVAETLPNPGFVFAAANGKRDEKDIGPMSWTQLDPADAIYRNPESYRRIVSGPCVCSSSVMMRTDRCREAGSWTKEPHYCPDWFLFCRLALRYDVAYVAEPMVFYRMHEASEWHTYMREECSIAIEHPQQVRWQLLEMARQLGGERRVQMTVDAIVRHYAECLSERYVISGRKLVMSRHEFERSLRAGCRDRALVRRVRQRVLRQVADHYSSLGQQHEARGGRDRAGECYRKALRFNPLKVKTWARWLRLSAHQQRH